MTTYRHRLAGSIAALAAGLIIGGQTCEPGAWFLSGPDDSAAQTGSTSTYYAWQYIGNSTAALTGDAGALSFTAACETTYSNVGARWCSSEELVRSTGAPPIPDRAWVRSGGASLMGALVRDNATGAQEGQNGPRDPLTCTGWSGVDSLERGLAVDTGGRFLVARCDTPIPVACCMYRLAP